MLIICGKDIDVVSNEMLELAVNPKEMNISTSLFGTAAAMFDNEAPKNAEKILKTKGWKVQQIEGTVREDILKNSEENLSRFTSSNISTILDGSEIHFLSCFKKTPIGQQMQAEILGNKVVMSPINIAKVIGTYSFDSRGGAIGFGLDWIVRVCFVESNNINDRLVELLPTDCALVGVDSNAIASISQNDFGLEIRAFGEGNVCVKGIKINELLSPGEMTIFDNREI